MGMGTTNNNSTPSTATTTTSLERSHFEALFPTTTTSTTTQSKWAAAATPTAPARAAPALRAPAPAANKPILSPTDLREHHPPAPQCHSITSGVHHRLLKHGKTCEGTFFRHVSRGTTDCLQERIGGQIDEDTRLKLEGKEHGLQQCTFAFYLLLMNSKDFRS